MPTEAVLSRLHEILGPKGVIVDPALLEPHLVEWRGLYRGTARVVVKPANTDEVAAVVKLCCETRTPIVPQGGNTGLVGGAVADEKAIILSLARMNKVRALDKSAYTLTVEAGVVLADVQKVAEEADRLFPLSLAAEGSCQIGGNLSTNAGGTAVLRYGNSRDLVLGLEVVLPNGEIIHGLHGLRKDNTGYDLRHLFLGAEGTLGIITAAVLKLFPRPRDIATAFVAVEGPQAAIDTLALLRESSGDTVTMFELMSRFSIETVLKHVPGTADPVETLSAWYALIELSSPRAGGDLQSALEEGLGAAMENGWVTDAAIAQNDSQRAAFRRIREEISDAQKHEGGSIKHDISVPLAAIPAFLERADAAIEKLIPGTRPCSFGHAGDGNLHYNLSQPVGADREAYLQQWEAANRVVHDIVQDLGGSFSAEHGIGTLKVHELEHYKSPAALEAMRQIKRALDPYAIMNPGKVIAS
jgi:FAD/FMN-containing dehydrogenase